MDEMKREKKTRECPPPQQQPWPERVNSFRVEENKKKSNVCDGHAAGGFSPSFTPGRRIDTTTHSIMAPAPTADPFKAVKDVIAGTCGALVFRLFLFVRGFGGWGACRWTWDAPQPSFTACPGPRRPRWWPTLREMGVVPPCNALALAKNGSARFSLTRFPLALTEPHTTTHHYPGGIAVTMVGHPFDTVKVRLQTQPTANPVYCALEACVWEGETEGPLEPPAPTLTHTLSHALSHTPNSEPHSRRPGLRP